MINSDARSQWPTKFDFPADELPSQVRERREALDKQVNLLSMFV